MDRPASPAPHSDVRLLALVVESETEARIATADRLAEAGFEVLEAWSAQSALLQIERHPMLRLGSCPSMRWKFGVELERPSVRRPEVELL